MTHGTDALSPSRTPEAEAPDRSAAAAVVAEAVALAAEAAADHAAAAARLTSAAAVTAAARATEAAQHARQARSVAASATARSVAEEAVRAAARVRDHAERTDRATRRVLHAASAAAAHQTRSAALGSTPPDAHLSALLAETVLAARALGADTAQVAALVALDTTAAATSVLRDAASVEVAVQVEVDAVAAARHELARETAASVARRTDALAAAVATAARDAAAALLTDPQRPRPPQVAMSIAELAAELSHDLLVPLASVMASVELLADELTDHPGPAVATLLDSAARGGDRMVRMLHRSLVPPPSGRIVPTSTTDAAALVQEFLTDAADLLAAADATVEVTALPHLAMAPGDLYSVVQNLLTNAVKFARPGVPPVVRLDARRKGAAWRVSVRDNGTGMPQADGLDVFARHQRGTDSVEGHGIGLATVVRLVTAYGGRVGSSPADVGAEIWFEVPDAGPGLPT